MAKKYGPLDAISMLLKDGVPANANMYLRSLFSSLTDTTPPTLRNDAFTPSQLEILAQAMANNLDGKDVYDMHRPNLVGMGNYNFLPNDDEPYNEYDGPFKKEIGHTLDSLFNDTAMLNSSVGGFQMRPNPDTDSIDIDDPFDFTGHVNKQKARSSAANQEDLYGVLRTLAPAYISSSSDDTPKPRYQLSIPNEMINQYRK